jgi:hypothetical protein
MEDALKDLVSMTPAQRMRANLLKETEDQVQNMARRNGKRWKTKSRKR